MVNAIKLSENEANEIIAKYLRTISNIVDAKLNSNMYGYTITDTLDCHGKSFKRLREIKFLEELDFTTHSYSKKQLSDEKFVQETPEAQLATHIFGHDKNVGTALIRFEQINSKQWQEKKNEIVADLREKTAGIEHNKNVER